MTTLVDAGGITPNGEPNILPAALGTARAADLPTGAELGDWNTATETMTWRAAARARLPIADLNASLQRMVFVAETRRSTDRESHGVVTTYGTSLRLLVTVAAQSLDFSLTLPAVAAKAELNMLQASTRLSVTGFVDDAVGRLLPKLTVFDVDAYVKYLEAVNQVQEYVVSHSQSIRPVVLARVNVKSSPVDLGSLTATFRAIRLIADGRSVNDALRALRDAPPDWADVVKEIYEQFDPDAGPDDRPRGHVRDEAQDWLDKLSR
jgi:hypothetical protein